MDFHTRDDDHCFTDGTALSHIWLGSQDGDDAYNVYDHDETEDDILQNSMTVMMTMMNMTMLMILKRTKMMMRIFCNNQLVKEANGKPGGNLSRPEQTMGQAETLQ